MNRCFLIAALGFVSGTSGCSSAWRTEEPVTAATYRAELSRPASSVGRLARLAVVLPTLHVDADAAPEAQALEKRAAAARALQAEIASYLRDRKGYEVVLVADRNEARDVDGVVRIERWIKKPWSTAKAVGNVFLLNIPLLGAMSALNLRVTIEEAGSGRTVWRAEAKGEVTSLDDRPNLDGLLGDLDNAVPAILRR